LLLLLNFAGKLPSDRCFKNRFYSQKIYRRENGARVILRALLFWRRGIMKLRATLIPSIKGFIPALKVSLLFEFSVLDILL
jgi:hypothetical protein